jgi:histidinol-phosphate aminotransferase
VVRVRRALDGIPTYVPGRSAESVAAEHGISEVVKLASNEAVFGPLPAALEAVARAARDANRYPDDGTVSLREALAAHYGFEPDEVLAGNGSVTLCQQAVLAVAEPGAEVLFGWPSFEVYPIEAQQAGADAVRAPLRGHRYDLDAMGDLITDRTRIVFVCTPNNPTGGVVFGDELGRLLARVPDDCLVVIDEAYREFVSDPSVPDGLDYVRLHPNVAVFRTFSKAYGMAALRVGYAIASADVIATIRKMASPFVVNGLAQAAALASLGAEHEMRARVAETIQERARVFAAMRALELPVAPSEANFHWLAVGDAAVPLGAYSERHGVVVRPFAGLGVRITVGTPHENDRMLEVIRAALADGVLEPALLP